MPCECVAPVGSNWLLSNSHLPVGFRGGGRGDAVSARAGKITAHEWEGSGWGGKTGEDLSCWESQRSFERDEFGLRLHFWGVEVCGSLMSLGDGEMSFLRLLSALPLRNVWLLLGFSSGSLEMEMCVRGKVLEVVQTVSSCFGGEAERKFEQNTGARGSLKLFTGSERLCTWDGVHVLLSSFDWHVGSLQWWLWTSIDAREENRDENSRGMEATLEAAEHALQKDSVTGLTGQQGV